MKNLPYLFFETKSRLNSIGKQQKLQHLYKNHSQQCLKKVICLIKIIVSAMLVYCSATNLGSLYYKKHVFSSSFTTFDFSMPMAHRLWLTSYGFLKINYVSGLSNLHIGRVTISLF